MRTPSELAKELDCWTEEEFASFTGCTPGTLESWRKRGKGPAFMRAGNAVLYPRDGVLRWMKRGNEKREARQMTAKDLL